jgi:hypothetical protein
MGMLANVGIARVVVVGGHMELVELVAPGVNRQHLGGGVVMVRHLSRLGLEALLERVPWIQ